MEKYYEEEWRWIIYRKDNGEVWDFTNKFQVSNYGRIRSVDRVGKLGQTLKGRILKQRINKGHGLYYHKGFNIDNKNYECLVNKIVAQAFPEICGEWWKGCHCAHLDGDSLNNKAWNIECQPMLVNEREAKRCKRVSEALKGRPKPANAGRKTRIVIQYTLDMVEVARYQGLEDVASHLKCSIGNLSQCCNGKRPSVKGFVFRYDNNPPLQ